MLVEYLNEQKKILDAVGIPKSISHFILEHGKSFTPTRCDKKYRLNALPQQCFKNAYKLAKRYKYLRYVEGLALGVIPTFHAWCVRDGSLEVIDPTWDDRLGIEYYGIPLKFEYVEASILKSNQYSVLDDWQNNWPIYSDPISEWKYDHRSS